MIKVNTSIPPYFHSSILYTFILLYFHVPIPPYFLHSFPETSFPQMKREWLVRRSRTASTGGTILVASASFVRAVCVEGRTNRGVRYCAMIVTRRSTSGVSLPLSSRSRRKTSGKYRQRGRKERVVTVLWAVKISRAVSTRFLYTVSESFSSLACSQKALVETIT